MEHKRTMENRYGKYVLQRVVMLVSVLLVFTLTLKAQNYYVFRNAGGYYLSNNGGEVDAVTQFSPSCVWIASGTLGNTSRSLRSYTDNTDYLEGSTTSLSVGNSQNRWRTNNNYLRYYQNNRNNRYVGYSGTAFTFSTSTNSSNGFIAISVTVAENPSTVMVSYGTPAITLNPSEADITYPDKITFNAEASQNIVKTTVGRIGYTTFTFGGDTYYYEGTASDGFGNRIDGVPSAANTTVDYALVGYNYTLVGDVADYLIGTSTTGSITYASSNPPSDEVSGSITVRGIYENEDGMGGLTIPTATASIILRSQQLPPIAITSAEDLRLVATDPTRDYVVEDDFDASAFVTAINGFTGTFDGGYHVISGLTRPLFTSTSGATIKNVVLDDVNISGTGNVGAVVGTASGATRIYNCGVRATDGSVISGGNNVGSIVGELRDNARVINCYSYANITGGTTLGGIVGNNVSASTIESLQTLVMNCVYYGKLSGTNNYPIYGGNEISNVNGVNTYNYYRLNAGYTDNYDYGCAQPIGDDTYLERFEFYRRILNSHRELAAYYCFGSANRYGEIGKWVLDKSIAPYPIIKEWATNTRKTLDRILPTTTESYAGKQVGSVRATVIVNGSSYSVILPTTDMDTARWDYTYGKVVLPFANEFEGWSPQTLSSSNRDRIITGWEVTSMSGGTQGELTTAGNDRYNFADSECKAKDLYENNGGYVYAQGGNLVIPTGVESITITAHWADAVYLRDAYYDQAYNTSYGNMSSIGSAIGGQYNGKNVYTDLSDAIDQLSTSVNVADQAIVLVGNYHYNQNTVGTEFVTNKAYTIMSIDRDKDQEPDYCWYSYHTTDRTDIGPHRFDFVANVGLGMAARVKGSTPVPTIGIWHSTGWSEYTETYLGIMTECEINSYSFTQNSPWIANGGVYHQLVHNRDGNGTKLSYIRIGGNTYIKQFYPGNHDDNTYTTTLCPVNVCGGEIEECYMSGRKSNAVTTGSVFFWCNGGYIHEFLGAYMEPVNGNVTAEIDHALIGNFYGGGANANKPVTGDISITVNNSYVGFFCGGPKVGNMSPGTTITIQADGTTFGRFYGGGYGGTALTRVRAAQNAGVQFNQDISFPLQFSNYTDNRLKKNGDDNEFGTGYGFEYFLYSGGNGTGVARFYVDYASLSLATVRQVNSTLNGCTVLQDFYGGGCQSRVAGNVTSVLTNCRVYGNVFGGGYTATATPCLVYPTTQPTYSTYIKSAGSFTEFGNIIPDTCYWVQVATLAEPYADVPKQEIYTTEDMSVMGEVSGNTNVYVGGTSQVDGGVYGGGNMSRVKGTTTVTIESEENYRINEVYGGANQADVEDNTTVNIRAGRIGNVFGANNKSGVKSKEITVNISGGISDYVYGAGNIAPYTGNPVVKMTSGMVREALFGGGYGETAIVTGNPVVRISGGTVGYTEKVSENSTIVRGGNVFGGGNAANVKGKTDVTIMGGTILHNVYGGGNQADVEGATNVVIGQ